MSSSSLVEAVAAVILDGATLTFRPVEFDGTALPTGMIVDVRIDRHGRIYRNATEVGFGGLSLSGAADEMLADTVFEAMEPIIHAALDDEDTGSPRVEDLLREPEPAPV